jgi:ribosomal protein S18 acetylase RimI-like enzyme
MSNPTQEALLAVRKANAADLETIVAFNAAMARETENKTLDLETLRAGVAHLLEHPEHGEYWLCEAGLTTPPADEPDRAVRSQARVVGQLMVTYEWSDWRNCQFWWIQSVYVAPEYRKTGVYRALHQHVARLAGEQPGVGGLRLYVDRNNARAQAVYRRMGMRETNYLLFEEDWSAGRE